MQSIILCDHGSLRLLVPQLAISSRQRPIARLPCERINALFECLRVERLAHICGTASVETAIAAARAHGVDRFVALTMGSNVRMLDVLHNCGFPCQMRYDNGDILATLDITAPPCFPLWTTSLDTPHEGSST